MPAAYLFRLVARMSSDEGGSRPRMDDGLLPSVRNCRFADALPCSPADRAKIAHGNADRLLKRPV